MIIYAIKKQNHIVYIGQTKNTLGVRRQSHLSLLKTGKHYNKALQDLYENDFEFEQLDFANSQEELNKLEDLYIEKYKDQLTNSLNFRKPTAEASLKSAKSRTKFSYEDLVLVLKRVVYNGQKVTEAVVGTTLTSTNFNDTVMQGKAKHYHTKEVLELIKLYKGKQYNYVDPTGKVHYQIKNIAQFAKQQEISPQILYRLNKGEEKVQGWITFPPPPNVKPGIDRLRIQGPDGTVYEVDKHKDFEEEHNLHARAVGKIKKGKVVKGYKLYSE